MLAAVLFLVYGTSIVTRSDDQGRTPCQKGTETILLGNPPRAVRARIIVKGLSLEVGRWIVSRWKALSQLRSVVVVGEGNSDCMRVVLGSRFSEIGAPGAGGAQ